MSKPHSSAARQVYPQLKEIMVPDNEFGVTQDDEMLFAIPLGMGRWAAIDAVISFVDGHCHKIELPGFMTRSGASFGITATFHVVENSWRNRSPPYENWRS